MSDYNTYNNYPYTGNIQDTVINPNDFSTFIFSILGMLRATYNELEAKLGDSIQENFISDSTVLQWNLSFSDDTKCCLIFDRLIQDTELPADGVIPTDEPDRVFSWQIAGKRNEIEPCQKISFFTNLPVKSFY